MKYLGSVGVGGVLSEIGLSDRNFRINEEKLVQKLCERFEVAPHRARETVQDTVNEKHVVREGPDIVLCTG